MPGVPGGNSHRRVATRGSGVATADRKDANKKKPEKLKPTHRAAEHVKKVIGEHDTDSTSSEPSMDEHEAPPLEDIAPQPAGDAPAN